MRPLLDVLAVVVTVLWHRFAPLHGFTRRAIVDGFGEPQFEQIECWCGAWIRVYPDGSLEVWS